MEVLLAGSCSESTEVSLNDDHVITEIRLTAFSFHGSVTRENKTLRHTAASPKAHD